MTRTDLARPHTRALSLGPTIIHGRERRDRTLHDDAVEVTFVQIESGRNKKPFDKNGLFVYVFLL